MPPLPDFSLEDSPEHAPTNERCPSPRRPSFFFCSRTHDSPTRADNTPNGTLPGQAPAIDPPPYESVVGVGASLKQHAGPDFDGLVAQRLAGQGGSQDVLALLDGWRLAREGADWHVV